MSGSLGGWQEIVKLGLVILFSLTILIVSWVQKKFGNSEKEKEGFQADFYDYEYSSSPARLQRQKDYANAVLKLNELYSGRDNKPEEIAYVLYQDKEDEPPPLTDRMLKMLEASLPDYGASLVEFDGQRIPWDTENMSEIAGNVLWGYVDPIASERLFHKALEMYNMSKGNMQWNDEKNKYEYQSTLFGPLLVSHNEWQYYGVQAADFVGQLLGGAMIASKLEKFRPWVLYNAGIINQEKYMAQILEQAPTKDIIDNARTLANKAIAAAENAKKALAAAESAANTTAGKTAAQIATDKQALATAKQNLRAAESAADDARLAAEEMDRKLSRRIYNGVKRIAKPVTRAVGPTIKRIIGALRAAKSFMRAQGIKAAEKIGVQLLKKISAALAKAVAIALLPIIGPPLSMIFDAVILVISTMIPMVIAKYIDEEGCCPSGTTAITDNLPEWASTILSLIPILGDLYGIFYPFVCVVNNTGAIQTGVIYRDLEGNDVYSTAKGHILGEWIWKQKPYAEPEYMYNPTLSLAFHPPTEPDGTPTASGTFFGCGKPPLQNWTDFPFCVGDFTDRTLLDKMAQFYYNYSYMYAAMNPPLEDGRVTFSYISKFIAVVASSELSCDVVCEMKQVKFDPYDGSDYEVNAAIRAVAADEYPFLSGVAATYLKTSKSTASDIRNITRDMSGNANLFDRRFYLIADKDTAGCVFSVTGCTHDNGMAPDVQNITNVTSSRIILRNATGSIDGADFSHLCFVNYEPNITPGTRARVSMNFCRERRTVKAIVDKYYRENIQSKKRIKQITKLSNRGPDACYFEYSTVTYNPTTNTDSFTQVGESNCYRYALRSSFIGTYDYMNPQVIGRTGTYTDVYNSTISYFADASGFYGVPTPRLEADGTYSYPRKWFPVESRPRTPFVVPQPQPAEQLLAVPGITGCSSNVSCYSREVATDLMNQYNTKYTDRKILKILRAFTSSSNRCDYEVEMMRTVATGAPASNAPCLMETLIPSLSNPTSVTNFGQVTFKAYTTITFTLRATSIDTGGSWASIFTFSKSMTDNNADNGARMPAAYFSPNSTKFHLSFSYVGNAPGFITTGALALNQDTNVTIQISPTQCITTFTGGLTETQTISFTVPPPTGVCSLVSPTSTVLQPYFKGVLTNLAFCTSDTPIAATTTTPQPMTDPIKIVNYETIGLSLNPTTSQVCTPTILIKSLENPTSVTKYDNITLNAYSIITFTLKPTSTDTGGTWATIFTLTKTMTDNVNDNGSRMPAVYYHPNSTRVHISYYTNKSNIGFVTTGDLPLNKETYVVIRHSPGKADITFTGGISETFSLTFSGTEPPTSGTCTLLAPNSFGNPFFKGSLTNLTFCTSNTPLSAPRAEQCAFNLIRDMGPNSGSFIQANTPIAGTYTVTPGPTTYSFTSTIVPKLETGDAGIPFISGFITSAQRAFNYLLSPLNDLKPVPTISSIAASTLQKSQDLYQTVFTAQALQGCPAKTCQSDDILQMIMNYYNNKYYYPSTAYGDVKRQRMKQVLKAAIASPTECDILFNNEVATYSNIYMPPDSNYNIALAYRFKLTAPSTDRCAFSVVPNSEYDVSSNAIALKLDTATLQNPYTTTSVCAALNPRDPVLMRQVKVKVDTAKVGDSLVSISKSLQTGPFQVQYIGMKTINGSSAAQIETVITATLTQSNCVYAVDSVDQMIPADVIPVRNPITNSVRFIYGLDTNYKLPDIYLGRNASNYVGLNTSNYVFS